MATLLLTTVTDYVTACLILLIRGTLSRGIPDCGAKAVPAGGFAPRTRAASGHHLAGKRTGLRGARWTGQARGGQNTRPSRVPGNVVLELSQRRLRLRWRVPQWSAGRRARPDFWRASAPVSADNGWMRLSAPRFPRPLPRDANELRNGFAKLGRGRAARTNFFSSPRDKLGIACIAGKVWNNNHSLTPDIFDSDNEDDAGPKREET
jgi:hypothetical protein